MSCDTIATRCNMLTVDLNVELISNSMISYNEVIIFFSNCARGLIKRIQFELKSYRY